jgi:hypothetical protein
VLVLVGSRSDTCVGGVKARYLGQGLPNITLDYDSTELLVNCIAT